ncbi:porin family protein [Algoriphagus sediminis]|uniref:Porin family protein n=1 Tax=Algoriphagus sediminis TaxID=3057113 RepID=A0ABT7Y995_9BACT|nr:porin family protein [Algoriphagus sediminis]MDN3203086.1 porin family protein [Algoriphagus sediminis]
MKKLLVIALLMLSGGILQAQNFAFGPRAGLSQTKISLEKGNFTPGDAEVGYHVGVFARLGGAGLYVQPEILYTQTSGTFIFNGPTPGGNSSFNAEFNRLDIPVMVGFKLFKILRLQAGPIASIDINSKLKDAVNVVQEIDFKSSTLGYQAGIGVDVGNLYLDAKYEGGLSSVTDNIGDFETDQRINQWVFSVGFKLF